MASIEEMDYWLRGRHDEYRLECIEIKHPSFSRDYRFVRNNEDGVRVKHANKNGVDTWYDYEYLPLSITAAKSSDDLQQGFTIAIGDVGEIMPQEIRRLRNGSYRNVKPIVNYRVYLSSNLASPMRSALGLEVTDNQTQKRGAVFICKARELNKNSTGAVLTIDLFPSQRGFS